MSIDLPKMKQRLEQKQAELQTHIASLNQAYPTPVDPIELTEGPQDLGDVTTDTLEREQEQATLVNEQALLTEVQEALKRIDNGTYGYCVVCGQPIPEKRLEAIPWASRCVKDEAALEERNLSQEELYDADTQ